MELRPKHVLAYMATANELATRCKSVYTAVTANAEPQTAMLFPAIYGTEVGLNGEEVATFRRITLRVVKLSFGISSLTVFDRFVITHSSEKISDEDLIESENDEGFAKVSQTLLRTVYKIAWNKDEVKRASRQYINTLDNEEADLRMVADIPAFMWQLSTMESPLLMAEQDMARISLPDLKYMGQDLRKYARTALQSTDVY